MTQVKYSGEFPSMRVQKTTQQAIQDALSWGKVIVDNNTFHYGEYGNKVYVDPNSKYYEGGKYRKIHNITHSSGCHFCDTNKAKKVNKANALGYNGANWERTYVCNTFVTAMYAHGAMDKTCYKYCSKGSCVGMNEQGRSSRFDNSDEYKYMGKLAIKDLKAGDILVSASHMQCVYAPVSSTKVKIIEATSYIGKFGNDASKKSIRIIEKKPSYTSVYRFVGTINKTISINMGEISDRVKLMQKFLNWYGEYGLDEDGIFFDGTLTAVKDFQKKEGLTVDGQFGSNSLAKAQTIQKEVTQIVTAQEKYSGAFPDWVELSGNIIATTARQLAYTEKYFNNNKSKCTWNSKRTTHATDAFMKAINKVYPKRSGWSKQCQDGASCDVGSGTVIRYCGADSDMPRGLDGQFPRMEKSKRFKDVGLKKSNQFKAGDVGMYMNKGNGAHIWISLGNGVLAEANHTSKYFFHIKTKSINNSTSRKKYYCFRMVVPIRKYMKKGDTGSEIIKLQKFLNWAGFSVGTVDGDFGDKTFNAVKAFQTKVGLTVDGEFGEKSLVKAKEYTIEVQPTKKPYSGTFPKLPARRYFKRGDKGVQVKYLQKFLNWYGNYGLIVDGVIGSKTIVAVEKFQKSEKLDVDGLFGKKCLAKAKTIQR